ncbi:GLPGLI family protein [Mucilaginibacter agri]|uniref:GLPGLI family protein n=1 Tax=Mucilaginibacter agri TaxID=2695265 RepID=A0A966DSV2_9SPHI|nr:GLPGLI family protein [Mucilaginibacter agri]NCD70568.1 GLPGLI family protein [Mucilaginibacter agri]
MKKLTSTIIALLIGHVLFAQGVRFATSGTIEFEKKVNMYAILQKRVTKDNESFYAAYIDSYKKKNPQFKTFKSTLAFSDNKTLFTPVEDENGPNNLIGGQSVQYNTIFTDVFAHASITQKHVFEETFLVKDSTRKINWKLTSETREIAGYTCRRANALVMDSIYVVAFYTDQIPVSGGPESFMGLPGMILGVALPHENVTWFATKVTDAPVVDNALRAPNKGKPVNNAQLKARLQTALKSWGSYANETFKALLL